MGKVWDVTRPVKRNKLNNQNLMTLLWLRGVSVADVFEHFYKLEEMNGHQIDEVFGNDEEGQHGRQLTVQDAELAGKADLPVKSIKRQPF